MRFFRKLSKNNTDRYNSSSSKNDELSAAVSSNEQMLRDQFAMCNDIEFRSVPLDNHSKILLVFLTGSCDTKTLDEIVLKPILFGGLAQKNISSIREIIRLQLIPIAKVKGVSKISEVVDEVLMGNAAFLIEGESTALIAELGKLEKRGIEEPPSETVIRGPRDGFTETLRINTSLIRRRIKSPKLKNESFTLGEYTKTSVEILYIEGIAQDSIVEEVRKRIGRIRIDSVLESGYIEDFIEDVPFSPFPQVQNTERPDVVCASLLEGKVAIVVDNTPYVLIVPMTFWTGLQSAEDYYERSIYTTFIRWIRFTLLNIALLFPSLYVAITTFHQQLIPTNLLISVAAAREGVPFPGVIEALLMEFMFEALREAGIRLPKPVGSAVSIVGALVIGQAAVQAGIISAPMVIVVATTGIASFGTPRYNLGFAYRILRFPILVLAGMFGFYGIVIGVVSILIHLINLRSFGVPYLGPVAPQSSGVIRDVFLRAPRWSMNERPLLSGENKQRIPEGQKPSVNRGKETK
ncbi:spore germination protein [Neobacillus cucumis]|uniref:spore germination protein n=1 Tax=Neobacillus cucumis TaxID=1740721 RepID=UPI001964634F|nr:spore germination protein [Neobacillus cucumis]MBM7650938.1 spore germination protein KA [Neobacillus cucumis]